MKKRIRMTQEQRDELVEKYKTNNYSCDELAEIYNVSGMSIRRELKNRGIKCVYIRKNDKYTFNKHYFDIIDDAHKAYWLGWMYSDGCNSLKRNVFSLGLQEEDREIIEKFKIDLESNHPIKFHKRRTPNRKNICKLYICSRYCCDKLNSLGVFPNKSLILKFPTEDQVPKHLLRHWLRGMWDGDGCFVLRKTKYKNRILFSISANLASSLYVCEGVKEYLNSELGINCGIYTPKDKNNSFRKLIMGGAQQTMLFLNWLYQNDDIKLIRKDKKLKKIKRVLDKSGWKFTGKTRHALILEFNGKKQSVSIWSKETGIPTGTIRQRLRYGWTIEKTLTQPTNRNK